jgi:hypothetical protein
LRDRWPCALLHDLSFPIQIHHVPCWCILRALPTPTTPHATYQGIGGIHAPCSVPKRALASPFAHVFCAANFSSRCLQTLGQLVNLLYQCFFVHLCKLKCVHIVVQHSCTIRLLIVRIVVQIIFVSRPLLLYQLSYLLRLQFVHIVIQHSCTIPRSHHIVPLFIAATDRPGVVRRAATALRANVATSTP